MISGVYDLTNVLLIIAKESLVPLATLPFIVDIHMPLRWSGRNQYLLATDIALLWSAGHIKT
jgi:hypothetical protein